MESTSVRQAAAVVSGLAEDARGAAGAVRAASSVDWHSVAATELRRRLSEEGARLCRVAADLEEAAAAMRRHGAALEDMDPGLPVAVVREFFGLAGAPWVS